jgi:adenosine deaminase
VAVRNFGIERAIEIAEHTAGRPHPYVVGFSLAGDEAGYPPAPYLDAYRIAAGAGLGCTVHAGEWAGAESVRGALALPVTRIAHGVRAIEDPDLVAELARRQITLEVCPTSNVVLGVFPTYQEHPFPVLREAGIPLTLGSDDPPYFGASVAGEYAIAHEHFGLSDEDLVGVTRTAIEASFAEPALRDNLLTRLVNSGPASR